MVLFNQNREKIHFIFESVIHFRSIQFIQSDKGPAGKINWFDMCVKLLQIKIINIKLTIPQKTSVCDHTEII